MSQQARWVFEFAMRCELRALEKEPGPADHPVLHLPGPDDTDFSRSAVVEVAPSGAKPWVAVFSRGPMSSPPAAPDHLIGWPDGASIGFVGGGLAYVVDTETRGVRILSEDPWWPVTDVAVSAEHELVVLADFVSLDAYDATGKIWESRRLAWDELEIVRVKGDVLTARGYDAPNDTYPEFEVDLRTGEARGAPYNLVDA